MDRNSPEPQDRKVPGVARAPGDPSDGPVQGSGTANATGNSDELDLLLARLLLQWVLVEREE
jgi:hypothetical protein